MARSVIATDDFSAYGSSAFPSSNWTDLDNVLGQIWVIPAGGEVAQRYSSISQMRRSAGTYSADQYAKGKILGLTSTATSDRIGVTLRSSSDVATNDDGYLIFVYDDAASFKTTTLVRRVNGSDTTLATDNSQAWAAGDTIEAEVTGVGATVTIAVFRNGIQVFIYGDSDASRITAADRPGVVAGKSAGGISLDDWEGGDVTASANPAPGAGSAVIAGQIPTTQRILQIAPIVGMIAMAALNPFISNSRPEPSVGAMTISGLAPTVSVGAGPTSALQPSALAITGQIPVMLRFRTISPSLPSSTGDTGTDLIPTLIWQDTKFPGVGLATMAGQIPSLLKFTAPGVAVVVPVVNATPAVTVGQIPNLVRTNGNNTELNVLRLVMTLDGLVPFISGSRPVAPDVGSVTLGGLPVAATSPTVWVDVASPQAPTWTDL